MKNSGKCIVLVSKSGYSDKYRSTLEKYIEEGIELFSVVGKDCEVWEEEMDWLCVELDTSGKKVGAFCNTTSHPNETKEEVIEFSHSWKLESGKLCEVEIIEI